MKAATLEITEVELVGAIMMHPINAHVFNNPMIGPFTAIAPVKTDEGDELYYWDSEKIMETDIRERIQLLTHIRDLEQVLATHDRKIEAGKGGVEGVKDIIEEAIGVRPEDDPKQG